MQRKCKCGGIRHPHIEEATRFAWKCDSCQAVAWQAKRGSGSHIKRALLGVFRDLPASASPAQVKAAAISAINRIIERQQSRVRSLKPMNQYERDAMAAEEAAIYASVAPSPEEISEAKTKLLLGDLEESAGSPFDVLAPEPVTEIAAITALRPSPAEPTRFKITTPKLTGIIDVLPNGIVDAADTPLRVLLGADINEIKLQCQDRGWKIQPITEG